MPRLERAHLALLAGCVLGVLGVVAEADAQGVPLNAHVSGAIGGLSVRPLARETSVGTGVAFGVSIPRGRRLRALIECAVSTAADRHNSWIVELPHPGGRSLTTLIAGGEASRAPRGRGLFAALGLGLGRFTLSGATRGADEFDGPAEWWLPGRDRTGVAIGASIGYRTSGGPGPFGFELAARSRFMPKAGESEADEISLGLGLVW